MNSSKLFFLLVFFYSHTSTAQVQPPALAEKLIPEVVLNELLAPYSELEKKFIRSDLENIRLRTMDSIISDPTKQPIYLATAGAPGSRKSTTLELLLTEKNHGVNFAYIDPDPRALFLMASYNDFISYARLSSASTTLDVKKAAYEKWRGASNFIANTLLNEAFSKRVNIAHGTTLTGPHVGALLEKLKKAGYQIEILLCIADKNLRANMIRYRNESQGRYQSSPEDAILKAHLLPEKFSVFLDFADKIDLYFTEDMRDNFTPVGFIQPKLKKISISSPDRYKKLTAVFDSDKLATTNSWGKILGSYKEVVELPVQKK